MKRTSTTKKDMSFLQTGENAPVDTVRAGIAPRPLLSDATPHVPFDVPFAEGDGIRSELFPKPALSAPASRPRGCTPPPLKGEGGYPLAARPGSPSRDLVLDRIAHVLWSGASRFAPSLLNRRRFRALVLVRASRHANRREG